MGRLRITLDGVDRQLENIGTPMTNTLTHVDVVTKSLEDTAGSLSRTADLTRSAVSPALVNLGATLSGVTAGYAVWLREKTRKSRECFIMGNRNGGGGFFAGFLFGAVAGAAAAAFLTQDDARERLAGKAREAGEKVGGVTSQWQSSVSDLYERGRQVVDRAEIEHRRRSGGRSNAAQTTHDDLQRKAEG